ncbi:CG32251, partial [Drosophila busckii]
SAKQAMDTMQAIQSEQQRLHREAHISVPYHQPKPRTLKEFLNRRTINQPLETALAGGSPMPLKREPRRSMAVRMNSEELQAYAKLMEERAKEATEFFKSDSEQDDDDDRDKEDIDKPAVQLAVIEDEKEPEQPALTMEEVEELLGTGTEPEQESLPSALVEGSPIKASLVTEVVELPRLDLSTLAASPSVKPTTPRISEAIRRLKDEVGTDASPSLRGDANMVIDLETGDMFAKKPTGVDDLLQRLMKTREAKKHKTTETVNILSTSHGKLELSKITRQLHDEEPVQKEQKPGAAYLKLQEQLKALINKKRMEDMRKKQVEEMEEEEVDDMDIDEEYEPDAKPGKKEFAVNEDEEIVDELPEETAEEEEPDADKETEDTGEDEQENELEADNDSSSSSESEPEEQVEGKRKSRIIRAFEDDNSDEELLQTPKPGTTAPVTATQLQLSDQNLLFDAESQRTPSDDENELLGLCSGKFSGTQGSTEAPTVGAIISQIPITQAEPASQMPDELEALCSGVFETQKPELEIEPASNKILSSDEEQQAEKPRQKKLTKKRQKKKAKLGFSDDEESVDEEEDEELSAGELEPVEDVPETFVDYDSEENEILVEMTKKDRKMRAANFVEKEAELSESEWGSADEDEKNMDTYDMELGDEDQFDREKLQHELGQIHARKMLDQDIRDVRKIKEMLFEDDEGAVRQRQFRWKNADNAGFSLDDQGTNLADGEANEGSGDEENEHLWRKVRFEREQLLLEKGLKAEAANSPLPLSPAVGNTSIGAVRKMTIIRTKTTNVELKKNSPFLISKNVSNVQQQQRAVRGSFLVRDKDTLNKLAGMTKGAAGDVDGAAGTVSKAKAKNFVFATLTEEEHENQKRKAADLLNSSSETGINFMKKPRLEPRREKCLIDQLL